MNIVLWTVGTVYHAVRDVGSDLLGGGGRGGAQADDSGIMARIRIDGVKYGDITCSWLSVSQYLPLSLCELLSMHIDIKCAGESDQCLDWECIYESMIDNTVVFISTRSLGLFVKDGSKSIFLTYVY